MLSPKKHGEKFQLKFKEIPPGGVSSKLLPYEINPRPWLSNILMNNVQLTLYLRKMATRKANR